MKPLSILLVDDEEGIRELVTLWLTRAGHDVVSAGSAREAERLLSGRIFDLLITDVVMPDGDGLELITQARRRRSDVRILAISGGGQYLQGVDCLKIAKGLGAHAVVMKPFNSEQLLAAVNVALPPRECAAS